MIKIKPMYTKQDLVENIKALTFVVGAMIAGILILSILGI